MLNFIRKYKYTIILLATLFIGFIIAILNSNNIYYLLIYKYLAFISSAIIVIQMIFRATIKEKFILTLVYLLFIIFCASIITN